MENFSVLLSSVSVLLLIPLFTGNFSLGKGLELPAVTEENSSPSPTTKQIGDQLLDKQLIDIEGSYTTSPTSSSSTEIIDLSMEQKEINSEMLAIKQNEEQLQDEELLDDEESHNITSTSIPSFLGRSADLPLELEEANSHSPTKDQIADQLSGDRFISDDESYTIPSASSPTFSARDEDFPIQQEENKRPSPSTNQTAELLSSEQNISEDRSFNIPSTSIPLTSVKSVYLREEQEETSSGSFVKNGDQLLGELQNGEDGSDTITSTSIPLSSTQVADLSIEREETGSTTLKSNLIDDPPLNEEAIVNDASYTIPSTSNPSYFARVDDLPEKLEEPITPVKTNQLESQFSVEMDDDGFNQVLATSDSSYSKAYGPNKIVVPDYSHLLGEGLNMTVFTAMFAPVSKRIKNEECRRQGARYLQELHKFTLWASQMFDATTKFPIGTLFGSTFDMGNFDECVLVNEGVGADEEESGKEDEERVRGRYCLSKINYDRIIKGIPLTGIDLRRSDHLKHANTSAWKKIELTTIDPSRNARNELHWAFCIPSACSASDWEAHLNDVLEHYASIHQFHAVAKVEESMCQVHQPFQFTVGGLVLCLVFGFFLLVVSACTFYDILPYLRGVPRVIKRPSLLHRVALCFSAHANIEKLLTYKESTDGLECIHGLKLMSLCLIIMGHRLMFNLGSPLTNTEFIEGFYTQVTAMILLNGPIVVDTFFGISGFLVCYLLLKEYEKKRGVNVLMLYVHRYVRLTPVYMVVLAFYTTLFIKFGSGPLWQNKVGREAERCAESWWTNVLYINNYVNPEKLCMFQSWYITCDMHLFMISPPIVYLLWKKPLLGKILLATVTAVSIVTSFLVTYLGKLDALLLLYMKTLSDPIANETFRNMYIPTHTRASPYFIGMAAGYAKYLIQTKSTKIPKLVVWLGWLIALVCIEGTVFSAWVFYTPGRPYNALLAALYGAFHRITWSIGTSWIIIAVSTGNGDFLKPFLVWPPIITLSRMTYSVFLVHGALQLYTVAAARNPYYGSIYHLIWLTLGDIVISFGISFVLTLLFESPIIGLEKIIFGRGAKSEEDEDEHNGSPPIHRRGPSFHASLEFQKEDRMINSRRMQGDVENYTQEIRI